MKNIFLMLGISCVFASCSTSSYTYRSTNINDGNVIASDVVVDVNIDLNKRIESTSSKRNSVEQAKTEAYYNAIKNNNIDIVVDPIFEVKTSDKFLFFGGKSVAKLMGFGATYKNPRTKVAAIKELKSIDTVDIMKFNNIYLGQPFSVKKPKRVTTIILGAGNYNPAPVTTAQRKSQKEAGVKKKGSFALKAGFSSNKFLIENSSGMGEFELENNGKFFGFALESGPGAGKKMGLRTELLYSGNKNVNTLNVPVLAKFAVTKGFSLLLGPSLTMFINDGTDEGDFLTTMSLGLDYGVSVDFGEKLFFDIRFSNGLTDSGYSDITHYNSKTFGLGYRL